MYVCFMTAMLIGNILASSKDSKKDDTLDTRHLCWLNYLHGNLNILTEKSKDLLVDSSFHNFWKRNLYIPSVGTSTVYGCCPASPGDIVALQVTDIDQLNFCSPDLFQWREQFDNAPRRPPNFHAGLWLHDGSNRWKSDQHTSFLSLLHNAWPTHCTNDPVNYTFDEHFNFQAASRSHYLLGVPLNGEMIEW